MYTIYLAGPISDGSNPYEWHETIQQHSPDIDWINPFTLHDYDDNKVRENADKIIERDLEAVQQSDAVLLRRIANYNLAGASIEAREAFVHDIPVVIWNEADSEIPLFLAGHATTVTENLEDAIAAAKAVATE